MAGVLLRRARRTPSFTQSTIAASLTWHMRKTSPCSTFCDSSTLPPPLPSSATTLTVPSAAILKVLSCEPYSSACWAIKPTFGTEPIVLGSKAPCALQSSMVAWNSVA